MTISNRVVFQKLFFLFLFFSFSLFSASALAGLSSGMPDSTIGLLGGFRQNNMVLPSVSVYDKTYIPTTSYQVGILLLFPIADNISLRFGFIYVMRDMDFSTPVISPSQTGRSHLGYIDLPAALQVNIPSSAFYVWFGQMNGIKVNDTCDQGGTATNNCSTTAAPLNISGVAGLGWNVFSFSNSGQVSLEFEYEYGMNNIFPAFNTNTSGLIANAIIKFGI